MGEIDRCEACGKATETVHGRCTNCWHLKRPDLVWGPPPAKASLRDEISGWLLDGLFLVPGAVVILLAVFVFGSDVVILIGIVLVLLGALRFTDLVD